MGVVEDDLRVWRIHDRGGAHAWVYRPATVRSPYLPHDLYLMNEVFLWGTHACANWNTWRVWLDVIGTDFRPAPTADVWAAWQECA